MEDLQIDLRPETEGDLEFLAALYRDTRRHEVAGWGWPSDQQALFLNMQFEAQRRGYRQMYPDAMGRLVYVQGTRAGRMLVNEEHAVMHLIDIALLEEYRNRGLGTHLLTELQRECDLRKLALELRVLAVSPARRLYRRLGFEEVNLDEIYIQMERSPMPAFEGSG
jgi:ribosomal protein S18 acetylase RimI-like enzyme